MTSFKEHIFYHYILSRMDLVFKIKPEYFDSKVYQILFKLAQEYAHKYRCAPSAEQMKDLVRMNNFQDKIPEDSIDMIYKSQSALGQYTDDWLYDNATTWAKVNSIMSALQNAVTYAKTNVEDVTPESATEFCENIKGIITYNSDISFDESDGVDFFDATKHKQVLLKRFSSGYNYIDTCLAGGYFSGSLICFVGAPKIGKSMWLQNLCINSIKNGHNCAYLSFELPEEMIIQRMGANMFNIPAASYSKFGEDTDMVQKSINSFRASQVVTPGDLKIKQFPTSAASVVDIETYLLKKEEEMSTTTVPFKFKVIYVDYINIIKNYRNPNSEDTYMKIKQIAEDLRAMAIKNNWCVITATQTKREQYDSNDMTLQQISESSGLLATVDAMFGIIADPMMKAQGRYYLKCLADRVDRWDNTRKGYLMNNTYLRITEDANAIEDTSAIIKMSTSTKKEDAEELFKPKEFSAKELSFALNPGISASPSALFVNITGKDMFDK